MNNASTVSSVTATAVLPRLPR